MSDHDPARPPRTRARPRPWTLERWARSAWAVRLGLARVLPGLLALLAAAGVSILGLERFGADSWLVIVVGPVLITLAFLYLETRTRSVHAVVVSELDESTRLRLEDDGRSGRELRLGSHVVPQICCIGAPRRLVGATLRVELAPAPPRATDRATILGMYRAEWARRAAAHRDRLELAARFYGVAEVEEFVARWLLRDHDTVDIVRCRIDGDRCELGWSPSRSYDFVFGAESLDRPLPPQLPLGDPGTLPRRGLEVGPTVALAEVEVGPPDGDGDATLRDRMERLGVVPATITEVDRPPLPCQPGTVTVVVSESDRCIVAMERLGVTTAYGNEGRVRIHFVGEGILAEDLPSVGAMREPASRTARRAMLDELGVAPDRFRLVPTGLVFDQLRWQPVFLFVAFTPLTVAEVVASARRSTARHQIGQIVPIGWEDGDLTTVARVVRGGHPDIQLASNHAEAALLFASMYATGAYAVEGALW